MVCNTFNTHRHIQNQKFPPARGEMGGAAFVCQTFLGPGRNCMLFEMLSLKGEGGLGNPDAWILPRENGTSK